MTDDSAPARYLAGADSHLTLGEALAPFAKRFLWALAYFFVLYLIGTVGYKIIEEWSWFESFYMSVTTITSVGFMEVRPLSPGGRTFTVILIGFGITGLGIWWALITALIVELDLGGVLRRRQIMKSLENLSDHYIVCGAGRVGRVVVRELMHWGASLVVVERDPERASSLEDQHPGILIVGGDATKEQTLQTARVKAARGLCACLPDDADNLLVCLTARDMNPELHTVARAYNDESMDRLHRAGADLVISPTITGGIRMASSLLRPNVVSFLDAATIGADIELRLEETRIPEGSPLSGRSLADARIPQRTGLVVIALRRGGDEGRQIYNPGPDTRLTAGDIMIVLGREEQVQQLREYVDGK